MEITPEERVDLAESSLTIVESAILKFKELQGEDEDSIDVEFETVLADLEKYCKNQLRIIKGY